MTLQTKLDEIKDGFKEQADSVSLALMDRAARELEQSEILEKALRSGDRMPEFTLPAARGGEVNSRDLLDGGPLVVTFYRGVW
jgi:hypothetical protein